MAVKYSISYIRNQASGFSFSSFLRGRGRTKCDKCREHAVMVVTNQENPNISVNLCVECYNFYSIENLLEYKEHGPRRV
jgi:hypothetical protein